MTDSRVYKIDYRDGNVLRWSLTDSGVECAVDDSYTPTLYVSAHNNGSLADVQTGLDDHPAVARTRMVSERISFRHEPEPVLRVDVVDLDVVRSIARTVRQWGSRS